MSEVQYNPSKIDYSKHPVFEDAFRLSKNASNSGLNDLCLELNHSLLELEEKLIFDKNFVEYVKEPLKLIGRFWGMVEEGATVKDKDKFRGYIERKRVQLTDIILQDLAHFSRRGSYEPVYYNSEQLEKGINLFQNGFYIEQIDEVELKEFENIIKPYKIEIEQSYEKGCRSREALSINVFDSDVYKGIAELLNKYDIPLIISNNRFEEIENIGFALELSPSDANWHKDIYKNQNFSGSRDTAYYHYDESRVVYKAILYLTDVSDENNGATSVIPESYQWDCPRFQLAVGRAITSPPQDEKTSMEDYIEYFMQFPQNVQYVSHFGWDVIEGSMLEEQIIDKKQLVLGPKGTMVVFAGGNIVHRGGLVDEGNRWSCKIVFEVPRKKI